VAGYRGGYLPLERRAIERGLRERSVLGVVATNALELGINIGGMDACVMTGYPGTIASTWQQPAGPAGEAEPPPPYWWPGLTAGPIHHHPPNYFFGRSPEQALFNPDNLAIAVNHIRCAAFELPFAQDETFGRFPHTKSAGLFGGGGILRHSRASGTGPTRATLLKRSAYAPPRWTISWS